MQPIDISLEELAEKSKVAKKNMSEAIQNAPLLDAIFLAIINYDQTSIRAFNLTHTELEFLLRGLFTFMADNLSEIRIPEYLDLIDEESRALRKQLFKKESTENDYETI